MVEKSPFLPALCGLSVIAVVASNVVFAAFDPAATASPLLIRLFRDLNAVSTDAFFVLSAAVLSQSAGTAPGRSLRSCLAYEGREIGRILVAIVLGISIGLIAHAHLPAGNPGISPSLWESLTAMPKPLEQLSGMTASQVGEAIERINPPLWMMIVLTCASLSLPLISRGWERGGWGIAYLITGMSFLAYNAYPSALLLYVPHIAFGACLGLEQASSDQERKDIWGYALIAFCLLGRTIFDSDDELWQIAGMAGAVLLIRRHRECNQFWGSRQLGEFGEQRMLLVACHLPITILVLASAHMPKVGILIALTTIVLTAIISKSLSRELRRLNSKFIRQNGPSTERH